MGLTYRYRRQHKTRIFNVGNRRRLAQSKDDSAHPTEHDANFFDPNNAEYTATREHLAMDTLEELLHWLMKENGSVGILGTSFFAIFINRRRHQFNPGEKKDDFGTGAPNRRSQYSLH